MRDRRQMLVAGLVAGGALATSTVALSAAGNAQAGNAQAGNAQAGNAQAGKAPDGQTPRALAERFAASLSAHDMAAFGALFDENYVNHQTSAAAPALPGKAGREATVGFFGARLAAMPDLSVAIEALVADVDRVAASFVYTGTHRGPYFGVAPTGKSLRFTSCDIFEVKNGRIVQHWGMGDIAGVLAQLKS